jgi:hypothetical protein
MSLSSINPLCLKRPAPNFKRNPMTLMDISACCSCLPYVKFSYLSLTQQLTHSKSIDE